MRLCKGRGAQHYSFCRFLHFSLWTVAPEQKMKPPKARSAQVPGEILHSKSSVMLIKSEETTETEGNRTWKKVKWWKGNALSTSRPVTSVTRKLAEIATENITKRKQKPFRNHTTILQKGHERWCKNNQRSMNMRSLSKDHKKFTLWKKNYTWISRCFCAKINLSWNFTFHNPLNITYY